MSCSGELNNDKCTVTAQSGSRWRSAYEWAAFKFLFYSSRVSYSFTFSVDRNAESTPHEYEVRVLSACDADTTFSRLRHEYISAPMANQRAQEGVSQLTLAFGNPIEQVVDVSNRTIQNVALPSHWFHPGVVDLSVDQLPYGTSVITIRGTGSGGTPDFNNAVGIGFFSLSAQYAAKGCFLGGGE